jgi:hypothetical protein
MIEFLPARPQAPANQSDFLRMLASEFQLTVKPPAANQKCCHFTIESPTKFNVPPGAKALHFSMF